MKTQFLLFLSLLATLLTGCAQNPVTGRENFVMMSESQEISMGRQSDQAVRKQYGVYNDSQLQAYVNEIGQKLAKNSDRPNLEYHFTVVDSPDINAFALPGGYIYITRGILPYLGSEAELAAVLGHEIGHVAARHGVAQYTAAQAANIGVQVASIFIPELRGNIGQNLTNILGNALLSGYGREHELEADHLGSIYIARSDYDPHAMIDVLSVLKNQETFDADLAKKEGRQPQAYHGVFASHPDNDTRLQNVVADAGEFLPKNHPAINREIFLGHIDGMNYGVNPSQGVIRGNRFLHAGLGFAIDFPKNWKILNTPEKLTATSPRLEATIELTLTEKYEGAPRDFLETKFDNKGDIRNLQINGIPAALLDASGQKKPVQAAAIDLNRNIYLVTATAKTPESFDLHRAAMKEALLSFHRLSTKAEEDLAKGLRLTLHTATNGDTYAALAHDSPLGANAESRLRLLNGAYPDGEPRAGQTIKLVR